ncbi:MAG: YraN family protein [Clostridia bacterium]|nr:YraN family protein [Clostridia bacterium]
MIGEPRRTGLLGEMYAGRYLRKKGYDIWAANYRTKAGEIDIIAFDGVSVCIVEVKTRHDGGYFPPSAAVDHKKEENVKSAAAAFMGEIKSSLPLRFDIIEVVLLTEDEFRIRHLENAF